MQNHLTYTFETLPKATRFLNHLKNDEPEGVKGRRVNGGLSIAIRYTIPTADGFDTTCSALDDLAESLGGREETA